MPLTLQLFTRAELRERFVFRTVPVELSLADGRGRLWLDVSRGGYEVPWQRALQHLGAVGRRHLPALPWDSRDLLLSCRARDAVLDGRSASLPLFVAWASLLSGVPLPAPFLATGVALDGSEALLPAPRDFIQGKLDLADALARQLHPSGRTAVWLPEGSDFDESGLSAVVAQQVATLPEAARRVLGLTPWDERAGDTA